MLCKRNKEHGDMEEKHTEERGTNMIKYTCEYPGCGFTGTDLETKEHLNLREDNGISQRKI
jgi:hypothetical protein